MIGAQEIVLLMVFALLVFGPKRLPEIARQVGRFIGEVRRVSSEFEQEVRDAAEPFAREVREAEDSARSTYQLDADHSTYVTPAPAQPPEADPPQDD